MLLTPEIMATALGSSFPRAYAHAPYLQQAMDHFHIDTPERQAAFLANLGHESGGLRYVEELWGPTPQQKRYERNFLTPWPRTAEEAKQIEFATNRLAYSLGNHTAGDGYRYRGRGWLQNTGRYNYARAREGLRSHGFPEAPDFEALPEALALPLWAAMAGALYWAEHNLNQYADAGDFDGVCDLINRGRKTESEGDANGWGDRFRLWEAAKRVIV